VSGEEKDGRGFNAEGAEKRELEGLEEREGARREENSEESEGSRGTRRGEEERRGKGRGEEEERWEAEERVGEVDVGSESRRTKRTKIKNVVKPRRRGLATPHRGVLEEAA